MEDKTLKSKLLQYIDAGFPIIYINTFEEDKVDDIIREISAGKEVYEWNEVNGYIDFELIDFKKIDKINQDLMPISYVKLDSKTTFKSLESELKKEGFKCVSTK